MGRGAVVDIFTTVIFKKNSFQPLSKTKHTTDTMSAVFQQILEQVEQNNITEARNMIKAYLKENPRKEQGWVVAFNIFHKKENKVYCLEQILAINPTNTKAKNLLYKIQNPATYSTKNNGNSIKKGSTQSQEIVKDAPLNNIVDIPPVEQLSKKKEITTEQVIFSNKEKNNSIKKGLSTDNSKQATPEETPVKKVIREIIIRPATIEKTNTTIKETKDIIPPKQAIIQQEQIATKKSNLSEKQVAIAKQSHEDMCIVLSKAVANKELALIQLLFQDEAEKVEMQLEEVLMKQLVFKSPSSYK